MGNLATTRDTLYQKTLVIEQPVEGYRFGTDAMLLAASLIAQPGETVLELGCGVGAVLLTAAQRFPHIELTGIEREDDYARLAEKNIAENKLQDRIRIVQGDITDKTHLGLGTFHHVLANPPFFQAQPNSETSHLRRKAREEDQDDTIALWMKAANRLLKPKGSVTFIHSADRLDELVLEMKKFCGGIKIFPLWPMSDRPAKRIIVSGIKGSRAPLSLLPGLVLHDASDKYYTQQASAIITTGSSLWETV